MRVMMVILLSAIFGGAIFIALDAPVSLAQNSAPQGFHVNSSRLQASLEKLNEFGRNADGGVTRQIGRAHV